MTWISESNDYFCKACGEKLNVIKRKNGYDKVTGEPLYYEQRVCPNKWSSNLFIDFIQFVVEGEKSHSDFNVGDNQPLVPIDL